MKNYILLIFCGLAMFTSCKNESTKTQEKTKEPTPTNKYVISPFSASPEFKDAEIKEMAYSKGIFDFTLAESSYSLGEQTSDAPQKMCANSGKGQHIHLIMDNQPYAAKYTNSFEYDVTDGEHYLLAFLSRSYHESIKTDKAHVAKKITVSDKGITEASPIEETMLFYSRPKGTYVGKANTEKIMLDFYPVNADIGGAHKVLASINGESHTLDSWKPYFVEGLPMGENTIELTLVDKDGNIVDAPLNPVSRTFTLKPDTKEDE